MRGVGIVLLVIGVGLAIVAGVAAQPTFRTPGEEPTREAGPSSSTGSGQAAPPRPSIIRAPAPEQDTPGCSTGPTGQTVTTALDPTALVPNGGIEGIVVRTPMCAGPPRPDEVCDAPYQATIRVWNDSGALIGYFESDASGHFSLMLPPGTYTLQPGVSSASAGTSSPGRMRAVTVTVSEGVVTPVRIEIDTGIR